MSIKRKVVECLTAIHKLDDSYGVCVELDNIKSLLDQLQEPQTPRCAPDYPEHGQWFWQEALGKSYLCKMFWPRGHHEGFWMEMNGPDNEFPAQGLSNEITRWLPVQPPQFTEQG